MIEEQERYADPVDAGSATAEIWLNDQINEHRYQMLITENKFAKGRCRNCSEKISGIASYCDEDCRNDHQNRISSDKRNGKYRGG